MIKTRLNDWFISNETAEMEDMIGPLTARYERVHLLGYSMGGFAALRFAAALRADVATVVSPQVSLDPEIVPFETRYAAEAAEFDPDAGGVPNLPGLHGVVLFDPFVANDRRHADEVVARFPNMYLLRLPFGGHPATGVLRDAQRGGVVQRIAMQVAPMSRAVSAHRATRRGSGRYWTALARKAAERRPKLATYALQMAEGLSV